MQNNEFTVSQISVLVKQTIELNFIDIWVKGEVSGFKEQSSGHLYFNLKDQDALLKAVCWKSVALKHNIKIKDGMMVRCFGSLTTFKSQSVYQIQVHLCEDIGTGNLLQIIEQRKKMLQAEGLFDESHKKALPKFPQTIGIITSPTGAVIQDMLHRIQDRFPLKILLWPVAVQGENAAEQITQAINGMDRLIDKPDVLIVARGGGSIEDLMPFNQESVIRAVYHCSIPVVSAVGHETDTTLIDYVSDIRAPTPTAAAEFAVKRRDELVYYINNIFIKFKHSIHNSLEIKQLKLDKLKITEIDNSLGFYIQKLDYAHSNLENIMNKIMFLFVTKITRFNIIQPNISHEKTNNLGDKIKILLNVKLQQMESHLENLKSKLEANSYHYILNKGFAFITNKKGEVINSKEIAMRERRLSICFQDGDVIAEIEKQMKLL